MLKSNKIWELKKSMYAIEHAANEISNQISILRKLRKKEGWKGTEFSFTINELREEKQDLWNAHAVVFDYHHELIYSK